MSVDLVVATDGDRAVGVMKDVVADAAEYCSSYEAETTGTHHNHRRLFHCRQLDNRLAGTSSEPNYDSTAHLYSRLNRLLPNDADKNVNEN